MNVYLLINITTTVFQKKWASGASNEGKRTRSSGKPLSQFCHMKKFSN
jgi:hypothetical protein